MLKFEWLEERNKEGGEEGWNKVHQEEEVNIGTESTNLDVNLLGFLLGTQVY